MAYQNLGTNGYFEIPTEILKDYYTSVSYTTLERQPSVLDTIPKETGFSGNIYDFPVSYGLGGGVSSKDYRSWETATENPRVRFQVGVADNYGTTKIHIKELMATRNDKGAYLRLWEEKAEMLFRAFDKVIETQAVRRSTQPLGTISVVAGAGPYVVTLSATDQARFFEIRGVVEFGPAGNAPADEGRVIAIDTEANTITIASITDDAAGPATAPLAADEIYLAGNWQNSGTVIAGVDNLQMLGLADWIPLAAPVSGENFNNVDRSVDATRLAGHRVDFTAGTYAGVTSPFEQVQRLATQMAKDGGRGSLLVCGPEFHHNLRIELDAQGAGGLHQSSLKVERGMATAHFKTVALYSNLGLLNVLMDPKLEADRFYILSPDSWKHISMGGVPSEFSYGGRIQPTEVTQNLTLRAFAFHNLVCRDPSSNGVAKIA